LTGATGVDRHVGIDRIWFAPTYNEWSPDTIRLSDGTIPTPSIAPTSGNQGGGGGVLDPPGGGSGGGTCVGRKTPIGTYARSGRVFRAYDTVRVGQNVKGQFSEPYIVLKHIRGTVSEWYEVRTANGIRVPCSKDHPFIADTETGERIEAQHLRVGQRLACEVRGRKGFTAVTSIKYHPTPLDVGTFMLRHPQGLAADGRGMYLAGYSKAKDRGLFCGNLKSMELN
jgi:hypothetical protein